MQVKVMARLHNDSGKLVASKSAIKVSSERLSTSSSKVSCKLKPQPTREGS